jgi:SAM-dependent methyltransferase
MARTLAGVSETPEHVLRNRVEWDQKAADYAAEGLHGWAEAEPSWGVWRVPEEQAGVLPPVLAGADSLELGCGTGYVSAWLARRGARPVGLDNSAAQLATAAAARERFGLRFPLIHASAEQVPCADATFDLVISEYGASIWCASASDTPSPFRQTMARCRSYQPTSWVRSSARIGGRLRSMSPTVPMA